MGFKKLFKNFSYSFIANASSTLISMILVFFVPKLVGVTEYSYWQLYMFYVSYVGFFHFGWADGVYLRFGGRSYESLDKNYFHTQFVLITLMELLLGGSFVVATWFLVDNRNKIIVFFAVAIVLVIQIPRTLLQYLLQATDRIVDYAKNFLWEKFIYAGIVIVLLVVGVRQFEYLILADVIARFYTLGTLAYQCRDVVFHGKFSFRQGIKDAWLNIDVGIKLMFANIASMLILGIVRWAIQNHWTVETFGKVSLSITASNLLMTCISAVSVVLYPMLKHMEEERYTELYAKMRNFLMLPMLLMLVVYYPAKVVLSWWLPQYADSLRYMALLFPMCIFESKVTMLINTYFKALREEKTIMAVNWITVATTVLMTGVTVYLMSDLILAILGIMLMSGLRCTVGEFFLSKKMHIEVAKDVLAEWALVLVFVISAWNLKLPVGMAIYLVAYAAYVFWKRRVLVEMKGYMTRFLANRKK